jgi:hypothetical protein
VGAEVLIDVLVRAGTLRSSDPHAATQAANDALQGVIDRLKAMPDAVRAGVSDVIASEAPAWLEQLVEIAPKYADVIAAATNEFDTGRHAEATGAASDIGQVVMRIAFALSLLITIGKLDVLAGGGADEPFRWEARLHHNISPELSTLIEATGAAIGAATTGGRHGAGAHPSEHGSTGRHERASRPSHLPSPAASSRERSQRKNAKAPGNRSGELVDSPKRILSATSAPPPASREPELSVPLSGPALTGQAFSRYRSERAVPLKIARDARDALADMTHDPKFRDIAPWWDRARKGEPEPSITEARFSFGLAYEGYPELGSGGGYRCVMRVQLPFRVKPKALAEISKGLDNRFGRFTSFRWSSIVSVSSGARWRGSQASFQIGSSIRFRNGDSGAVGLLLRDSRNQYFATTAGHLACSAQGRRLNKAAAISPATEGDPDPVPGALHEVSIFPSWRPGISPEADGSSDLAVVRIVQPGAIPLKPRLFDRRRAEPAIYKSRPLKSLPVGLAVAKAAAASPFQLAKVAASDIAVHVEDRWGADRWGTGLIEIAFEDNEPGAAPGDSGALALVWQRSYVPLGLIVARGRVMTDGHDAAARHVAYVQPLAGNALLQGMRVL